MALALDAMGGDLAPAATVESALRADRERGLEVILVGDDARLRVELRRLGAGAGELRIHHASEVVDVTTRAAA
ncbi:MAG: phosphate acyltransferase, partial [Myxococcales bacterium]